MSYKERFIKEDYERGADLYYKKYKHQIDALQENSPLKTVKSITTYDVVALGEQLNQWELYKSMFLKESGTSSELGVLPNLALDIITASYGASIVPLLASIQPLDEEQGTIYFKQTRAVDARGQLVMGNIPTAPYTTGAGQTSTNITAGSVFRNPLTAPSGYALGYAGETVTQTTAPLAVAVTANTAYNMTLSPAPIRPDTLKVTVTYGSTVLVAKDDGQGNIVGVGIYGTILNASTGTIELKFTSNVPVGGVISVQFGTSFEENGAIPRITTVNTSTSVNAEIFALATELGLFKGFSMKKRFNQISEDEMVNDLSSEMTAEIGNQLIDRLYRASQGVTTWNKKPDAGVAYAEHKLSFMDAIEDAGNVILNNAGRGQVNVIIAGVGVCAVLSNMPNFQRSNISGVGPHVFGIYNGNVTVIRCPMLPANEALLVYKGTGYFDAPVVYAPYMPLFITNTMPVPNNPLKTQAIAAVWTGMKVVVGSFITKLIVIEN